MNIGKWKVTTSGDNGQYLYIERAGLPGMIHIKSDSEGYVIDVWSTGNAPEVEATTCAEYSQLLQE